MERQNLMVTIKPQTFCPLENEYYCATNVPRGIPAGGMKDWIVMKD